MENTSNAPFIVTDLIHNDIFGHMRKTNGLITYLKSNLHPVEDIFSGFSLRTPLVIFSICLLRALNTSAQLSIWTDTTLVQSHGISLIEKNDSIYFTVSNQNIEILPNETDYRTQIFSIAINDLKYLKQYLNLAGNIDNEVNYATQAAYFIEDTQLWLLFQSARIDPSSFSYRLLVYDENYNYVRSISSDTTFGPLEYYFDSFKENTYLIGSALGTTGSIVIYSKFIDTQSLPKICFTQTSQIPTFYITSMICDQESGNMVLFHYGGILVTDTSLNIITDLDYFDIRTSDHGHVIQHDSFYYSNGTTNQPQLDGRRLIVFQKYSRDFEVLSRDTLGWPKWDNYPFVNRSIDYRNDFILTGGMLDGPFNGFVNFYERKRKFYLAKYDIQMNRIWYKEYGGDTGYLPVGLHLLPEGDALVYGYTVDSITLDRVAFLMYVDEHGELVSSKEIAVETPFRIHNQPGRPLVIDNAENIRCSIQVFSLNGQCVLEQRLTDGVNEIHGDWPPGVYTFVISSQNRYLHSGKWLRF